LCPRYPIQHAHGEQQHHADGMIPRGVLLSRSSQVGDNRLADMRLFVLQSKSLLLEGNSQGEFRAFGDGYLFLVTLKPDCFTRQHAPSVSFLWRRCCRRKRHQQNFGAMSPPRIHETGPGEALAVSAWLSGCRRTGSARVPYLCALELTGQALRLSDSQAQ